MRSISTILIAKNQEANIGRLIDSVLEELPDINPQEIVLVDSASTDRTREIARERPIKIIHLHADQPLTPAAGRYIGYQHTSGDLILFLDGDMELFRGWMDRALAFLAEHPDVAGVTGQVIDQPKSAGIEPRLELEKQSYPDTFKKVLRSGGAAVYRRSVMEEVGTFNPYLSSDEEPELSVRIRSAGYKIYKSAYPIALHYTDPAEKLSTLVGRWRRNLFIGHGQCLRYHLNDGLLWLYMKDRAHGLVPLAGVAVGIAALIVSIITGQWLWFGIWVGLLVLMILADTVRKRSLYKSIYSLLRRILIMDGTIRGFFKKPLAPETYPAKLDIVE